MSMMTKLISAGALAAAVTAGASEAATITSTGVTPVGAGAPSCSVTGSPANAWGSIDVLAGANFNATFLDSDAGGNYCFNLVNSSASAVAVTLAVITVNQGSLFDKVWGFTEGIQVVSEQLGDLLTVAQGDAIATNLTFKIAAGGTVFFDWIYGDPYNTAGFTAPEFDFSIIAVPVPVPAAGFMLVGALGGLVALRRRKKTA